MGKHYRQVASVISDTARKLRQIADHQDMQSEAVEAFRNIAREVANDISRAHERYDGVGQALTGYAPELRDAQLESAAALAQAKDVEADLAAANRLARAAQARIDAAPDGADTTADRGAHRRALAAAEDASDALAAARRRLSRATDARDAAARRAMSLVQDVKDSGDLNDGWWDNWGAKVGHGILDVAGLVPVIGEPADGINALWYGAEGDWTNAGLSAAGMIPIGGWFATGGKLVGKGVDAARGGDEAAQAGAKALALPQKANRGVRAQRAKSYTKEGRTYKSPQVAEEAARRDAAAGGPRARYRGMCDEGNHVHVDYYNNKGEIVKTKHYQW